MNAPYDKQPLPVTLARDALSRWDNEGGAPSPPVDVGKPLMILVVAGDPVMSLSLSVALTSMGHEVSALALTITQAVSSARHSRPDLIIVDAFMDDCPLAGLAPVMRVLIVPRMFNDGASLPRPSLRPGSLVIRRPFRTADLAHAIRQTMDMAV